MKKNTTAVGTQKQEATFKRYFGREITQNTYNLINME